MIILHNRSPVLAGTTKHGFEVWNRFSFSPEDRYYHSRGAELFINREKIRPGGRYWAEKRNSQGGHRGGRLMKSRPEDVEESFGGGASDGLPQPSEPTMDTLILNVCAERCVVRFRALSAEATEPFLFDRAEEI